MFKALQNKMLGKKKFQPFFEKLFHISKFGRNIGLPIEVSSSGEIAFIQSLSRSVKIKDEFVFFDIGANHGVYTEYILKFIPGKKHCYLFEPQKALYKQLKEKFPDSNVTVITKGCGSNVGELNLFSFESADTLASVYDNFKGAIGAVTSERIEVIKLDDFFHQNNISFIHLIKIDVEGHELEVLKGMKHYLSERKIGIIQFEFGSFNISSRTFFKDFWEILHSDYKIYRILRDGLLEIKEYTPNLEMFDTTNYVTFLK